MSPRPRTSRGSRREAHIEWLKLIDVSGPFLSVPVLTKEWPDLEPLDSAERDKLRRAHGDWQASGDRLAWIAFVLEELLGWQGLVRRDDMERHALPVAEHETVITPSFTLNDPASGDVRLLGMISDDSPVARVRGSDSPATPRTGWPSCAAPAGSNWGWRPTAGGGRWCGRLPGASRPLPSLTASPGQIHPNGSWFEPSFPCFSAGGGSPCRRLVSSRHCSGSR